MSLWETSWRYEQTTRVPPERSRFESKYNKLRREEELNEQKDLMAEQLKLQEGPDPVTYVEETASHVRNVKLKKDEKEVTRELTESGRALILVRQAALREQLKQDYRQYQRELSRLGLVFYRYRL